MYKQNFTINKLLDNFHFKVVKKSTKNIAITSPHIRRIGTVFLIKDIANFPKNNVFIFGLIEKQYLKSLKGNSKYEFFEKLKIINPSLIILTSSFLWNDIYEFARNCKNFRLFP